jgi:hypothetical protein
MTTMTGVLGQPYLIRQDIAVGVGVDQRLGFRWLRASGGEPTEVNLHDYEGVVRFESMTGDTWATFEPVLHEDGLCEIVVTPDVTDGPEWAARSAGRWAVILTAPDGTITCLAAGYLTITTTVGAL